jgi:protein-tyrosine phosphatase
MDTNKTFLMLQLSGNPMNLLDHTAIAIDVDPRMQRLSGTTVHGHHRFDVPYISRVAPDLWMGGCADGLELPHDIDHVVSLYPWESYELHECVQSTTAVWMYDEEGGVDSQRILSVARWVNECRASGTVLVHCQAGLNRSGLVTATALVLGGWHPQEAIAHLRMARSDAVLCNRSFVAWVESLDPASTLS